MVTSSSSVIGNLGKAIKEKNVATFHAAVARGAIKPFVLPYALLGTVFIPALYLAVPHTARPWLYQARFAVMALIVAVNAGILRNTSSASPAIAYGIGLYAYWGIMNCFSLLIWSRPQFDAARIVKVPAKSPSSIAKESLEVGDAAATTRSSGNGHAAAVNGTTLHKRLKSESGRDSTEGKNASPASVLKLREEGYEYYWEPYPVDAPFSRRLNWAFDLLTNFRGEGWNWAISTIPQPPKPKDPTSRERARIEATPPVGKAGYARCDTPKQFLQWKLKTIAVTYLTLDAIRTFTVMDPYFVFGATPSPLPPHLAAIRPAWLLPFGRSLIFLLSVYEVVFLLLTYIDVIQFFILSRFFPTRRDPWWHPSIFGSPVEVLDRGLAGFWGGFWHQTFRVPFSAPVSWLVKEGYLARRSATTRFAHSLSAFLSSGLLHACGSYTAVPPTKLYRAPLFFALSALGVLVQQELSALLSPVLRRLPRGVRRACNLLLVCTWLEATCWPLADDFATAGFWVWEPVPVSLFRGLGLGLADEGWLRWRWGSLMQWHTGKHWWDSGVVLGQR